jgi:drug/metabolite transporter (DMT)-like permease
MIAGNNPRQGIFLMIAAVFIFALQDGISRHLASQYNVMMVVMVRYWFFAAFVLVLAARQTGGIRQVAATTQLPLQIFRGVLLAFEICVTVVAFVLFGLVETHAVFICYPLLIAALSGPVLGEHVGCRRWSAILVGFVGVLIILDPGVGVFSLYAAVPVFSAFLFALYGLLTRLAARRDAALTSFFWTGTSGAVVMTVAGIRYWQDMTSFDWGWMLALCVMGALGHWTLIRCYEVAEASAVQPFAYLQLLFVSIIGISVFGETLRFNVLVGAALITVSGLFALLRERQKARAG